MSDAQWFGKQTRYEGLPLALRVRSGLSASDWWLYLPHLAVLTHEFDAGGTRRDGMPEGPYNRSLAAFDAAAHDVVEDRGGRSTKKRRGVRGLPARVIRLLARGASENEPPDPVTASGLMLVVETFGGKRIYYAAVREPTHADRWLAELRRGFPVLTLGVACDHDRAATWYERYATDFDFPRS